MQNVKHAVIACAGYGSRLGLNKPKCLVEINGRTLLSYLLEILSEIEDVRIVVGFMEDEVIQEAIRINPQVVIIRNPDYRNTTNAYSVYLATRDLIDPFLIVDGDMAINKKSFHQFLEKIKHGKSIIGICEAKTKDAVFVELDSEEQVSKFQRTHPTGFEWCGIAYLDGIKIGENGKYVFNEIEPYLPLPSYCFNCFEIDTPEDMELMVKGFSSLGYNED